MHNGKAQSIWTAPLGDKIREIGLSTNMLVPKLQTKLNLSKKTM